jgi:hypothetical protein
MNRRKFLATVPGAIGAVTLAGCASWDPGGAPGPAAEAPTYRLGDRWVYRVQDGFRAPIVWDETHEVTAIGPQGINVRVTAKGPTVDTERLEQWAAPGVARSGAVFALESKHFEPALVRYQFPLAPGERWSQQVRDPNEPAGPYGPLDRYTTVGGYEKITTPAGTYDAIRLRVFMRLDDETFWRHATECNYLVWYAPALGASVRELRDAEYQEKGSSRFDGLSRTRVQHAQLELVAFTRGR